eukprot:Hpha_TRINITY_DN2162_c0_g1::TRINITY_DN2162_c0_g1_i1::g.42274::m.42274
MHSSPRATIASPRVRVVFAELDINREGRISHEVFEQALRRRGFNFTPHAVHELFQKGDLDRDGWVTVEEFSVWARVYPNTLDAIYHRAPHRRPAESARLQQRVHSLEARETGLGVAGDVAEELKTRCKTPEEMAEAAAAMIRALQPLAAYADPNQGTHGSPQRQSTWATPWGTDQQRLGRDGQPYTWPQWVSRFGSPAGWAVAPLAPAPGAPPPGVAQLGERRVGQDGGVYYLPEWVQRFGSQAGWATAPPERRMSPEHFALTYPEWVRRYGSPAGWGSAPLALSPGVGGQVPGQVGHPGQVGYPGQQVGHPGTTPAAPEWVARYGNPAAWSASGVPGGAAWAPGYGSPTAGAGAQGGPSGAGPSGAGGAHGGPASWGGGAPVGTGGAAVPIGPAGFPFQTPSGAMSAFQMGVDGLKRDRDGLRGDDMPAAKEHFAKENQRIQQLEAQELKLVEEEVRLERVRDLMRAQESAYVHAEQEFNDRAGDVGSPRRARREMASSVYQ